MGRIAIYNFYERDLDSEKVGGGQLIGPPAYNRFPRSMLLLHSPVFFFDLFYFCSPRITRCLYLFMYSPRSGNAFDIYQVIMASDAG
jgi:hypothetical protein